MFGIPSQKSLIEWCRALRYGLHAGLSPVKIFRQQAKSGPANLRPLAAEFADSLKNGNSFADTLKPHRTKFPALFIELVAVGEKAGKLPEVFEELERYIESQRDSRRAFLKAITWPALSYTAAVMVVALLMLILGLIGGAFAPLGKTLLGPQGAIIILGLGYGSAGLVALLYILGRDNDQLKQKIEAIGLKIPGFGMPFRSFALQRFSLGLSMTHEAGMRADEAVYSSFAAASNNAYMKHAVTVSTSVRGGRKIAPSLAGVGEGLFPDTFIDSVTIGEDSGQISEVMGRVSEQYREEGIRQSKVIANIIGGLVYLLVSLLIIAVIISIVMGIAGVYQDAMKGL